MSFGLTIASAVLPVLLSLAHIPAQAVATSDEPPSPRVIPGRVTVMLADDVDVSRAAMAFGGVSFDQPTLDALLSNLEVREFKSIFPWRTERPQRGSGIADMTRWVELTFPDSIAVARVVVELSRNPHVALVEPVWEIPLAINPDDTQWPSQWAMEPPGPDPNFYTAWDIETGSDSIKYGCVDSGVNYRHRDLAGNIWVNPGEDLDGDGVVYDIDDLNGVDDDGNGLKDDLIGYDFLSALGSPDPDEDGFGRDTDPNDFNGHGTHVAGIAAAITNNGTDVAGAAGGWYGENRPRRGVQIMCLRVGGTATDGLGYVNSNDCASAIDYATLMGAHVINASWGGAAVNATAAANAIANGVTFCHAAGNSSSGSSDELDVVAGVLSVASVGPNSDAKSGFSNFGPWIDVSAPGSNILSTYSFEYSASTATLGGTSMASPMVAGLALLIRSAMPSLTKDQVDSLIVATADNIDASNPSYIGLLGSGRINALNALTDLASAKFDADFTDGEAPLTVQFADLSPNSPVGWQWSFGTGDGSTDQNPMYVYDDPGIYDVSLVVDENNPLGPGEEHLKNYVWVRADTVWMDSIEINAGESGVMPVYLSNTAQVRDIILAFRLTNHGGTVDLDSFKVDGLRTSYFEDVDKIKDDQFTETYAIQFTPDLPGSGSNYLLPGSGGILNLYVSASFSAPAGQVVTVDTITTGGVGPTVDTRWGDFWPVFSPGKIVVTNCAHGDANCDEDINIIDLTSLVDFLFTFGPQVDPNGGNVNGIPPINIEDVTYLVDYLFGGGPEPPG